MYSSALASTAGANFTNTFGADIVTSTLDTLNSGMYYHPGSKSAQSASYDFQKDVLSAYYTERGLGAVIYSKA